MLAGHYGVAYALRAGRPSMRLWQLFLAVQAADIAFSALAIAGIESLQINQDARGPLTLQLVSIPYTHSLLLTIIYGAACVLIGALAGRIAVGAMIGVAVVSHWLLDALVHLQDLPLTPWTTMRIGLGLWRWPLVGMALELGLLTAGYFWLRRGLARHPRRYADLGYAVLVMIELLYTFDQPPSSVARASYGAEVVYLIAILLAIGVDRADRRAHSRGTAAKLQG